MGRYIVGRCIVSRYIGGRFIVGRYIGGRHIVGRRIAVASKIGIHAVRQKRAPPLNHVCF
jgi:hypothetical protein